jgi:hypothetical protein
MKKFEVAHLSSHEIACLNEKNESLIPGSQPRGTTYIYYSMPSPFLHNNSLSEFSFLYILRHTSSFHF